MAREFRRLKRQQKRDESKKRKDGTATCSVTVVPRTKESANGFSFDTIVDLLKSCALFEGLIFEYSLLPVVRVGSDVWLVDFCAPLCLADAAMWVWMVDGDDSEGFPPQGYASFREASKPVNQTSL